MKFGLDIIIVDLISGRGVRILCDFNPYEMSDWIINKDRKGFEFF